MSIPTVRIPGTISIKEGNAWIPMMLIGQSGDVTTVTANWRLALESYLVDERKDSINSLVALWHKIAHGESVGTSLSQIKAHYRIIVEVVDFLASLVDPK